MSQFFGTILDACDGSLIARIPAGRIVGSLARLVMASLMRHSSSLIIWRPTKRIPLPYVLSEELQMARGPRRLSYGRILYMVSWLSYVYRR